jgi:hypothetical protein
LSYKFAVEFTPEKGHIPFTDGRVHLEATRRAHPAGQAPDAEAPERPQRVVEHVKRFAFREDLGEIR